MYINWLGKCFWSCGRKNRFGEKASGSIVLLDLVGGVLGLAGLVLGGPFFVGVAELPLRMLLDLLGGLFDVQFDVLLLVEADVGVGAQAGREGEDALPVRGRELELELLAVHQVGHVVRRG